MRTLLARKLGVVAGAISLAVTATVAIGAGGSPAHAGTGVVPGYDHVVQAVFENHEQSQIIGTSSAPYLTGLAAQGASFTQSFAIEHPSQPNYLDLFSGSNQGVTDDSCPQTLGTDNVAHQLIAAGKTFAGYSEGLPTAGSSTCGSGEYARKHAPWTNFSDLNQASVNQPYTAFPSDFTQLPTDSWVVPNLCNDMHDCSVATDDAWAQSHLDAYAQWAKTHNSLLIVTFDEDDSGGNNQIATIFVGAHVTAGNYSEHIDHFTVLRTIEAMHGLAPLGSAASRSPITDIFSTGTADTVIVANPVTWTIDSPVAGGQLVSGGVYEIGRAGTGQVIDDPNFSTSAATQQTVYTNTNGSNQQWAATANPDGSYTLKNQASGMCLDDSGASTAAGSPIIQWYCNGQTNQDWKLPASGSGFGLINQASGLSATAGGTANGSTLTQQPGTPTTWTFTKAS